MTSKALENIFKSTKPNDSQRARMAQTWLEDNGIPSRRDEAWKYTPPEKFMTGTLCAPQAEIPASLIDLSPYKVYFKDGAADLERSHLPQGMTLSNGIPDTAKTLEGFAGAIGAYKALAGVTLDIAATVNSDTPIIIVHENDAAPMLFVRVGKSSQVSILEAFSADKENESLCTPSTWFELSDNARAEHVKTVIGGREQVHIGTTQAVLGRDANFDSFVFAAGSKMVRQELLVDVNQSGAHTNAHGLFALRGDQHADSHVTLNHNAANTTSEQLFKMVLDDSSRGVFTGRLEIAKDAQKVDAAQLNKNLVLSKKAHVDTRPQLLVHADDVKCAHGATVGQLSGDEVFYLQSRGLSQSRAQKILCHAFASDAVLRIKAPSLRAWVSDLLYENFEQFALEKFEQ